MSLLLTSAELDRFATYLEMTATSGKQLIEQFEKLPGPIHETLLKRLKAETTAELIVAAKLRSLESTEIGGGE